MTKRSKKETITLSEARELVSEAYVDCLRGVNSGRIAHKGKPLAKSVNKAFVSMLARLGGRLSKIRDAIDAHIASQPAEQQENGKDEIICRLEDAIARAGYEVVDDPDGGIEKPDWILRKKLDPSWRPSDASDGGRNG